MKKEFEKEQKDNQIDDAFLDMPDMEDDEKFRQWLEEEYLKEADAIEEALFDGRKFEDNQDIVEKLSVSRENFYQRAREEGLLEDTADEKAEDEKNTEEAVPESTEKKILEFRKNADVSKDTARDANRNSGKKKHSYVRLWQDRRNRGPVSDLRVRCKYEQRGEPEVSGEQCADTEWE